MTITTIQAASRRILDAVAAMRKHSGGQCWPGPESRRRPNQPVNTSTR